MSRSPPCILTSLNGVPAIAENGTPPLSVALVGVGQWGTVLLRNLVSHPSVGQLTLCDRRAERLDRTDSPKIKTTTELDAVLDDARIDAVILATPISTHASLGLRVLEADKHLLVEKPMATDIEEASAMIEAAQTRSLSLAVGHTAQYAPAAREIERRIRDLRFGPPIRVEATRLNNISTAADAPLWDLAVHDLAIILEWLEGTPNHIQSERSDPYQLHITMKIGACEVELRAGRGERTRLLQVTSKAIAAKRAEGSSVNGEAKAQKLTWTQNTEGDSLWWNGADGQQRMTLPTVSPLRAQLDDFFLSVTNGVPALSDGRHGKRVVSVAQRIEEVLAKTR